MHQATNAQTRHQAKKIWLWSLLVRAHVTKVTCSHALHDRFNQVYDEMQRSCQSITVSQCNFKSSTHAWTISRGYTMSVDVPAKSAVRVSSGKYEMIISKYL